MNLTLQTAQLTFRIRYMRTKVREKLADERLQLLLDQRIMRVVLSFGGIGIVGYTV